MAGCTAATELSTYHGTMINLFAADQPTISNRTLSAASSLRARTIRQPLGAVDKSKTALGRAGPSEQERCVVQVVSQTARLHVHRRKQLVLAAALLARCQRVGRTAEDLLLASDRRPDLHFAAFCRHPQTRHWANEPSAQEVWSDATQSLGVS